MRALHALILLTITSALLAGGCDALKEKAYSPTEAEKKFTAFCLKEGNLSTTTKRLGRTLWIYAPIPEAIFDMKPSPDHDKPERKKQPYALLSLQAEFSQNYFKFNYDAVPDVLAGEPVTYGSAYNELYTKKRQLIYQALQESFFNAKDLPHDAMPEFVVVMLADIQKGLATKSIFYMRDLKQYVTEVIPPDEYYMRELNEVIGKQALIGDSKGKNAPYAEITWTNFLTDQIKNRIKFKFSASDFPPDDDPQLVIARIAANTLRFYPFTDYTGVVLYDVRGKKEDTLTKADLANYVEKTGWEDSHGRLTTIHFEIPKDPTDGLTITNAITTAIDAKDPQ
jgi:hypothetical protein